MQVIDSLGHGAADLAFAIAKLWQAIKEDSADGLEDEDQLLFEQNPEGSQ